MIVDVWWGCQHDESKQTRKTNKHRRILIFLSRAYLRVLCMSNVLNMNVFMFTWLLLKFLLQLVRNWWLEIFHLYASVCSFKISDNVRKRCHRIVDDTTLLRGIVGWLARCSFVFFLVLIEKLNFEVLCDITTVNWCHHSRWDRKLYVTHCAPQMWYIDSSHDTAWNDRGQYEITLIWK
jgi:hypothetical protein